MASVAFSLPCLVLAPSIVKITDQYYLVHYERIVDPIHFQKEIAEATSQIRSDQIRSDENLMSGFQAEIDERQRKIAEQQARHEELRQSQLDQND